MKSKPTSSSIDDILARLRKAATKKTLDGMARYGIPSTNASGVAVGDIHKIAKQLGHDHEIAAELWRTGVYEARLLACFVDEPTKVTAGQMEQWCRDFDSWAIVDTACFHLFDRVPHAWKKIEQWSRKSGEFQKRAAFALLACLALHDKEAEDELFARCLPLIEKAATDDRNFVKKGVSWALRSIGMRSPALHSIALAVARRLMESDNAAEKWLGKDVFKDLSRPLVLKRLAKKPK